MTTPCPHCTDAAALRRAFYAAAEMAQSQPLPVVWSVLYEAIRDTTAGLTVLAEMAKLRAENDRLRATLDRMERNCRAALESADWDAKAPNPDFAVVAMAMSLRAANIDLARELEATQAILSDALGSRLPGETKP